MNVSEENRVFATAPPDEAITLRELIALAHPLCRSEGTTIPDIAAEIIAPAQQCDDDEQLELQRLCAVFSLVLEYFGSVVFSCLADYLASFESTHALKRFLRSVTDLSDTLSDACEASIFEAFAGRLKQELFDEPF